MSPIEKLKAEAVALRQAETATGRLLKHCDALERVAAKHGYANWRACSASMGAEPDAPDAAGLPAASAAPAGRLTEGDFAAAREGLHPLDGGGVPVRHRTGETRA